MNFEMPSLSLAGDNHHQPLIGLATLMKMAFSGQDLAPLGTHLIERAQSHPDDANTLMDLSTVLQLKFNRDTALAVQAQALEMQRLYSLPASSNPPGIRLLAIMGPGDIMSNTPLEFLLEDSDISLDMLYVVPDEPVPTSLPEHDLVFVAVGESDQNRVLLKQLESLTKSWPCPVLNRPDRIAGLSRDAACALLKTAPGVVMPVSVRIDRLRLEQIGRQTLSIAGVLEDGGFPIVVRPVGSHAGRGLEKLDTPAAVLDYLQAMPDNEFYVSRFIDYRGQDGLFRKYRIVLIDGRPFACHMAISRHWMVHYLNADMTENPENRAEEARFMANFDEDFALRHADACSAIYERMGLDYLIIDCGETPDGKLLIFEVDSCAVVHAMDPVDIFDYKHPQMRKVFAAFREMLVNAMKRSLP